MPVSSRARGGAWWRRSRLVPSPLAVGIDVGGASARVGLVTSAGRLLQQRSFRTGIDTQGEQFLTRLNAAVHAAFDGARKRRLRPAGIGIGMPAFLDERGRVAGASNLPGLNGVAVGRLLQDRFGVPVRIENDVSAAASGEYYFGGHVGVSRRMLFLAVGTGVGGGMMVDGSLLRVARGCLGDPGHVIVDTSGRSPCRCGGNGCLEAVASGWALMEQARRLGLDLTPKQILARARSGDPEMARLAEQCAIHVGLALASLCVILNPDTIVLGGGVAIEAGTTFLRRAEQTLRTHAVPFFAEQVRVVPARVGRWAGLLGAASLLLFPAGGKD